MSWLWNEFKTFSKERGKDMSKAASKFGIIRSFFGVMTHLMYWVIGAVFFLGLMEAVLGFKLLWWIIRLVYLGILMLIVKVFKVDIPAFLVPKFNDLALSRKASGEEYERYVAEKLEEKGFYNVRLTPSSGDYGVDILAEKGGVKFAFQCKRYSHPVGVKAVQEIYAGCRKYGMEQPVVVTNTRFTPNAKTLADDLGVSLWELEMFDAIF